MHTLHRAKDTNKMKYRIARSNGQSQNAEVCINPADSGR